MRKPSRRNFAAAIIIASLVTPIASLADPSTPKHAPASATKPATGAAGTFHTASLQSDHAAHAWMIVGRQRQEIVVSVLRNAKAVTDTGGGQGGANAGALASSAVGVAGAAAGSLGAMSAIPFVGMAAPLMGLFGHKPKAPTQRDTWALAGAKAPLSVATQTPSFEFVYSDVAGVDPDAQTPVLVKLSPTSDNWRVVAQTERQLSSSGVSSPKFSEHTVAVTVESLGRGHVRLTPQAPLDPGEYGVALRPVKTDDASQASAGSQSGGLEAWQSMWDFGIEGTPSHAAK